ncbi:hypothetical protein R1sor_025945 [Riccia sorocarpa]|uniref:Uncharacterized protein n=1 Tax=Riccia sorocarpa TaxID=122646 RepID=A0ABD3GCS6_9MARC
MFPGLELLELVELATKGYTGFKIQMKWGSCEHLDKASILKKIWHYQPDATILYVLFTNDEDEALPDPWVAGLSHEAQHSKKVNLNFRVSAKRDIDLKFPTKPIPLTESKADKCLAFGATEKETSFLQDYPLALVEEVGKSHVLSKYMDSWTKCKAAPTSQQYDPMSASQFVLSGGSSHEEEIEGPETDLDTFNDPEAALRKDLEGNDAVEEKVEWGNEPQGSNQEGQLPQVASGSNNEGQLPEGAREEGALEEGEV